MTKALDDVWQRYGAESPQAQVESRLSVNGFLPFVLAAGMGGVFADGVIRLVKRKWPTLAWAPWVVLFGAAYALLRFVPREGVRIIVAGMYGRIGPETWDVVIRPLLVKLHIVRDAAQLPGPEKPKPDKAPKPPGQPGNAANCANDPLLLADGSANDGMWQPPDMERDIRPLAQAMSANRQMLYDMSGEIFNEMQKRQMVDPNVANETAEEFQKVLQDVFAKMAS